MKKTTTLLVALGLTVFAACSDDESASTDASGSADTTGSTAAADDASAAPDGEPIVFGTITGSAASIAASTVSGLEAAVETVNAAGGIDGRPLELRTCDDEGDPNVAEQCARDLTSDPEVLAIIGRSSTLADASNPILEEAGILNLEPQATASDYQSPNAYFSAAGIAAGTGGASICVTELGAERIAAGYIDITGGSAAVQVLGAVLAPLEREVVGSVPLSPTAADLAPAAAQLLELDPDCVVALTSAESANQLILALRLQGYDGPVTVPALTHNEEFINDELGESGEAVIVNQTYDPSSPLFDDFVAQMQDVHGDDVVTNELALRGWFGVTMFADLLGDLETIDRSTVLAAFGAVSDYDTEGLTPLPLDYTATGDFLGGSVPNLRAPFVLGSQMRDGVLEPIGTSWINVFTGEAL